jgi:hypothetical protein
MSEIGLCIPSTVLTLYTNRDFKWSFDNLDQYGNPTSYPAGALSLEFQVSTDGGVTPTTSWAFTISGTTATIAVTNTVAALIPARTKWQLVFLPSGGTAGGDPIAYGLVQVSG